MVVKAIITDVGTGLSPTVVNTEEMNALVVATRPLKTFENDVQFFFNSTYGPNMNQNASFGGIPEKIHNGIDDVLWTASIISGTWTFNSTDQAHAGTNSIDATSTSKNDVAQITKGSYIDLSGYTAFTGWIYITKWSSTVTNHVIIYGYDTGTGLVIGNNINIDDYINVEELGIWQKFVIPLEDLGLTEKSIDAVRIMSSSPGVAPSYYLDDIQIEETGSPIIYEISPKKGTWLHCYSMRITIVDEYDSTLADSSIPKIPYNSLLGVPALTVGTLYQDLRGEGIKTSYVIRQLIDILQFPWAKIIDVGTDGTYTYMTFELQFTAPGILKAEENDKLQVSIRDDLTGLIFYRMSIGCKIEERPLT